MGLHIIKIRKHQSIVDIDTYFSKYVSSTINKHIKTCEGISLFENDIVDMDYGERKVVNVETSTGVLIYYIFIKEKGIDCMVNAQTFVRCLLNSMNINSDFTIGDLTRAVETVLKTPTVFSPVSRGDRNVTRYRKIDAAMDRNILRLWRNSDSNDVRNMFMGSIDYRMADELRDLDKYIFIQFQHKLPLSAMSSSNYLIVYGENKGDRNPIVFISLEDKFWNGVKDCLKNNVNRFYKQFECEKKYNYIKLTEKDIENIIKFKYNMM